LEAVVVAQEAEEPQAVPLPTEDLLFIRKGALPRAERLLGVQAHPAFSLFQAQHLAVEDREGLLPETE
jgi:hypothetical protein